MKHLSSGLRVGLAMAFCAALLAPSALADNGKKPEERPGNSADAPGHNKDTEAPPEQAPAAATVPAAPAPPAPPSVEPPPAPPAQSESSQPAPPVGAASNEKPKHSGGERPDKPEKPKAAPPRPSGPSAPVPSGASTAHGKVLICHATGSATNPYVVISISVNAWSKGSGHGAHADDVFIDWSWPGDPRQKNDALCPATPPPGTTTTTTTSTTTPASSTTTTTASTREGDPKDAVKPAAAPDDPHASGPTLAPPASHATESPRRDVLSASASLAVTKVRGTLPFTGLPVWVLALAGSCLVAFGLLLRRRTAPKGSRRS